MPRKPPAPRTAGPLGQDGVLAELRRIVDEAAAGRGHLVLLAGEAGIGKTTMLAMAADYAESRGARVARGWGWRPAPTAPGRRGRSRATPTGPTCRPLTAARPGPARYSKCAGILSRFRLILARDRPGVGIDQHGDGRMTPQPGQAATAARPDTADRDT